VVEILAVTRQGLDDVGFIGFENRLHPSWTPLSENSFASTGRRCLPQPPRWKHKLDTAQFETKTYTKLRLPKTSSGASELRVEQFSGCIGVVGSIGGASIPAFPCPARSQRPQKCRDIPYHSIIGDRGRGDTPNSSDGVVPYWSSHLDGAQSEKIVPSEHGSH